MDKLNLDKLDHGEALDAAVVESIVVEKADFDHALKVCQIGLKTSSAVCHGSRH